MASLTVFYRGSEYVPPFIDVFILELKKKKFITVVHSSLDKHWTDRISYVSFVVHFPTNFDF